MLTRRRRALRGDDRGMTLAELVVGMTLLSLVGAMATTFFVGMSTQTNRVTAQSQDGSSVRTAMNQIAATLRLADTPTARPGYSTSRFLVVSSTEVQFFANIQASARAGTGPRVPPTKFDFQVAGGQLTERTYAPNSLTYGTSYDWTTNYPSAPTSTTVLMTNVANTNVFTYCSSTTDLATSCTATTTPDSVALVQVTLTQAALRGNAAQSVQTAVAITGAVS